MRDCVAGRIFRLGKWGQPMHWGTRSDIGTLRAGLLRDTMIDKRSEQRIPATYPVNLGGATGITSDVSASGIFFETSADFSVGSPISFTVEFDSPGGRKVLKCAGSVVRIETRDSGVGVAVRITESTMGMAE